ncbi:MAG: hypothetical protein CDV28_1588 [Candidatus Electronema aureum]|uniref:non-specific serine/threonine protein kinase n=1 Tax=Candidatus Electronema aureum TaxID=2005002 RepID=A0A521FYI4_9BACT|nr:MAG: hypothetical protein CDV28_1588 [Candidatus Electronema aureum]
MTNEELLKVIEEVKASKATALDLSLNKLTALPPELFQLRYLTWLNLSGNQLNSLPSAISKLTNLTWLNLSGNQLNSLPSAISKLTNLTWLDLSGNQLNSLPLEICKLPELETLRLGDNPLVSPPLEIATQGIEAMRQYFAELNSGTQFLNEVKILVVGDGEAGKTSLVKRLFNEIFDQAENPTHGINIRGWDVEVGGRKLKANIWDFGGQVMQHATHQFFFSKRCLYILVLDGRREEEPEYWLHHIKAFGGDSPVLVVTNKQDISPQYNLDHANLQQKYPNIRRFFRTSCKNDTGIVQFKKALIDKLTKVEMTAIRWPKNWLTVKQRMERMDGHYIKAEEYETICQEACITEKASRETLLDFLHDLGVAVHFKEFILDSMHVLRPDWVTKAVYRLVTAEETIQKGGRLEVNSMGEILHHKEGGRCCCPKDTHPFILKLMRRFELCYNIDEETVLIPQVLFAEQPAFSFDYSDTLRFVLRYDSFLPPSVFPRFMVKVHKDIKDNLCWRTGVLLEDQRSGTQAVVKSNRHTNRIEIWVRGSRRKEYLNFLWYSLLEINGSFDILDVNEGIPLPDTPSIIADYNTLVKYASRGIDVYFAVGSGKEYSVSDLLGLVQPKDKDELLAFAEKMPLEPADKESLTDWLINVVTFEIPLGFATINLTEIFKKARAYDKQRQKESGR